MPASACAIGYLLFLGNRTLETLAFFKHSARIHNAQFYLTYDAMYTLHCSDAVPFRLSRNLVKLLDPFLVNGTFTCAMRSANACLQVSHNQGVLRNYLRLFLRDDLEALAPVPEPGQELALSQLVRAASRNMHPAIV